jgi:flavin reductase (DIM6/NTAB) family NADH-FMN oxidoreductase RutF
VRIEQESRAREVKHMHKVVEPAILYFGTPVVLVTSLNEDGSANLAPISSAWWLGWRCMLGIGASSKTSANLLARRECVLNLPSVDQVAAVDRLARTTGRIHSLRTR